MIRNHSSTAGGGQAGFRGDDRFRTCATGSLGTLPSEFSLPLDPVLRVPRLRQIK